MGFSLGGLSAIARCPATIAQDGFKGGIYFDTRDRFCLDGQRLIAISGSVGGNGTEYRTEIDSFSRITSYGQQGSGPSYWKVWSKSGQILEYGNSGDSRVESTASTDVRTWAVNNISDVVGNAVTFSYHEDNTSGEHYPLSVDYGTNAVRFEYENRPDPFYGHQAGGKLSLTQRLTRITLHGSGTEIQAYPLRYLNGD
ncbi:MAG: hypothetical protein GY856_51810, partial [bacterium]|nr:hypothetical protein [bacterium]